MWKQIIILYINRSRVNSLIWRRIQIRQYYQLLKKEQNTDNIMLHINKKEEDTDDIILHTNKKEQYIHDTILHINKIKEDTD